MQKDYAFLQLFHLVLDEINKRVPSAPGYHPINWVMDEVYTFTETPSVARILAHLPSEYRSRRLQLFLVIQSFKQLAGEEHGKKGLEDVFFSFGNMVIFSLLDIEDCFRGVKNLFPFDPQLVKVPARHEGQHDIMENRDEQLAVGAYQLQKLAQRECYIRRFIDEARMDRIIHVGRTREVRIMANHEDVERLKDELMRQRGVPLRNAEKIIANRELTKQKKVVNPNGTLARSLNFKNLGLHPRWTGLQAGQEPGKGVRSHEANDRSVGKALCRGWFAGECQKPDRRRQIL
jgi:hypothetical protein